MPTKIIVPPSFWPVTLDEAKHHCRVDGADDDMLLQMLIASAGESAEHETGRALCTQTRELVLDAFPTDFVLHGSPIQSVESIKFLDASGTECTLDPQDYLLDNESEPGYVTLAYGKGWPATYPVPNAVRVRYVCGYGMPENVPAAIKQWMLLAIGTMYAQRESIVVGQAMSLPDSFWSRLLHRYTLYWGI